MQYPLKEKVKVLAGSRPENAVLPAVLSLGGFTGEALALCRKEGVGTAGGIEFF